MLYYHELYIPQIQASIMYSFSLYNRLCKPVLKENFHPANLVLTLKWRSDQYHPPCKKQNLIIQLINFHKFHISLKKVLCVGRWWNYVQAQNKCIKGSLCLSGGLQVYILAFTAGGFLNIALVTVLPELLQEDRPAHSCAQLLCLLFGTLTMATVAITC